MARTHEALRPDCEEPARYTLSDGGILIEAPNASIQYGWALVKRCAEIADYFLVHFQSGGFLFLPKRLLNEAEVQEVRKVLETHPHPEARLARVG